MNQSQEKTQDKGLGSLPVELLRKIVKSLSKKDFKCLRLMNRELNGVVSDEMFRSLHVEDTKASILQLQNVSASSFWSRQVSHLSLVLPIRNPPEQFHKPEIHNTVLDVFNRRFAKLHNVKEVEIRNDFVPLHEAFLRTVPTEDLYTILCRTSLHPEDVFFDGIVMHLSYSEDKSLTTLSVEARPQVATRVLESNKPAHMVYPFELILFESLASLETLHLRKVTLNFISTSVKFLKTLLVQCSELQTLSLNKVTLFILRDRFQNMWYSTFPDDWEDMVVELLQSVKRRKQAYAIAATVVDLEDISIFSYRGQFSADNAAITEWVEGNQPNLLPQLQAALQPCTTTNGFDVDNSSGDEEADTSEGQGTLDDGNGFGDEEADTPEWRGGIGV